MATGLIGSTWNNGAALTPDEIAKAREWSTGKTGAQVTSRAQELGLNADQFTQAVGIGDSTGHVQSLTGYGTDAGYNGTGSNFKFDGTKWNAPVTATQQASQQASEIQGPTALTVAPQTMTVQGQLNDILAKDGQTLQAARGRGQQQANERGLGNSSIGTRMAEDSVVNAALDIAKPDAATYYDAGKTSNAYVNQFARDNNMNVYQLQQMAKKHGYDLETMGQQQLNDLVKMEKNQGYTQTNLSTNYTNDLGKISAQGDISKTIASMGAGAQIAAAQLNASTQAALNAANLAARKVDSMASGTLHLGDTFAYGLNSILSSDKYTDANAINAAVDKYTTNFNNGITMLNNIYQSDIPGLSVLR